MNSEKQNEYAGAGPWITFNVHDFVKIRISRDQIGASSIQRNLAAFEVEGIHKADLTMINGRKMDGEYSHGAAAFRFLPDRTLLNQRGVMVEIDGEEMILSGDRDLLPYVMPLIQWKMLTRNASFIHGASISIGGKGILMPAWTGAGKTSALVELLKIPHSAFMGDDFAIICTDQKIYSYPEPFFIYPYHKNVFPHLFKSTSKFLVPSFMSSAVARIRQSVRPLLCGFPKLEQFFRKFTPEHMKIAPREALPLASFASCADLSLILFLERYHGTGNIVDELSAETASHRVIGNLYYEMGAFARELMMACGATGLIGIEDWFSAMSEVVRSVFKKQRIYRIRMRAMKPVDTGKAVAETVSKLLSKV